MTLILGTAVLAILAWWGSTGLIVLAVRQFDRHHGLVLVGSAMLAALGLAVVLLSADLSSEIGAFTAFAGALMIWAFFEMAFLLGWITGPRREPCPAFCTPRERFRLACLTVIHHEVALAAALVVLAMLLSAAPNPMALTTFALLWVMRLAAKFMLFLGARHSLSDMMPSRLLYLQSYFRTDRTTLLFPVVLVSGVIAFGFIAHALTSETDPFLVVSLSLSATFVALGLTELLLLNIPLRDSALWSWALPPLAPAPGIVSVSSDNTTLPVTSARIGGRP
jgi:putative photosynthetic complex assembly protein 2